jgi:hypothetical protein
VCIAQVTYTTDGTEDNGDIIQLVKLPPLVIVDPAISSVYTSATLDGSAVTMDIGDDSTWTSPTPDPDRYMDGVDITTADELVFFGAGTSLTTAAFGTPFVTPQEGWISAKIISSGTLNASVDLVFRIYYSCIS